MLQRERESRREMGGEVMGWGEQGGGEERAEIPEGVVKENESAQSPSIFLSELQKIANLISVDQGSAISENLPPDLPSQKSLPPALDQLEIPLSSFPSQLPPPSMQSSAYLLNQKGTKVVFGEDAAAPSPSSPPRPRGMTIHPSRMGTVPGSAPSTSSSFQRPQQPSFQSQGYQQPQPAGADGEAARPALNPNPYVPGNGSFVPMRPVRPPKAKLVSSTLSSFDPSFFVS